MSTQTVILPKLNTYTNVIFRCSKLLLWSWRSCIQEVIADSAPHSEAMGSDNGLPLSGMNHSFPWVGSKLLDHLYFYIYILVFCYIPCYLGDWCVLWSLLMLATNVPNFCFGTMVVVIIFIMIASISNRKASREGRNYYPVFCSQIK